jgi:hypothetical protein
LFALNISKLRPSIKITLRTCYHRWAHLLKQQLSIIVYHLLTEEKHFIFPFLFAANKLGVCRFRFYLKKTNGSCRFLLIVKVDFWNSVEVIIFLELEHRHGDK